MTDSDNQLITEFTVSNTTDGTSQKMPDGSKVFYPKVDADGKRSYTNNLKMRSLQVDLQFPKVLKASGLKKLVQSYLTDKMELQIQPNVDYQLTKAPQILESDDPDVEPVAIAYYKPIVRRTVVSTSNHKGLFA